MPSLDSHLILEGIVLGIAVGLKRQGLALDAKPRLRDTLKQTLELRTEFAALLRDLHRLGPDTYVKRALARLSKE